MPELPAIELTAESRERRRIALPPLGWVAPARANAGPAAMGLLFMLVAVGTWALFWFADEEPPEGLRRWGTLAFAVLFFLAGARLAAEAVRAPRWWTLRHFRGGVEPWGEGYRWRRSARPLPAAGAGWAKGCVGVAALVAFGVVINLVWFDTDALSGSVWLAYLLIPLFTLLILFMVGAAFLEAGRQLVRGPSRLEIETYPAAPGAELRATFVCREALAGTGRARAELACVEQGAGGGPGAAAAGQPVVEAVYSQAQQLDLAHVAAGRRILLTFRLPDTAPPTELVRPDGSRRYWLLEVSVPTRGLVNERGARFLVPVYRA